MKPATMILGSALLLVTGGSAAIILKQRAEIDSLLARMSASTTSRAPLLASGPAPVAAPAPEPQVETASPPAESPNPAVIGLPGGEVAQQRPDPRSRRASRFAEILADPEVAGLMKDQQKAELDGRYAALFMKLGLSSPEVDALKNLLAEKQLARMEARAVARAEGLPGNDREAMRELVSESDDEVEARMIDLLGADRYAALRRYENTAQERSRVSTFEQRLSYSSAPLQPYQSDAMVEILASVKEPSVRLRSPEEATAYLGELEAYNTAVYKRAQAVLSAAQLEALRQMQVERQRQARLGELMRRRSDRRD